MAELLTPELTELLALKLEDAPPSEPNFFQVSGFRHYEVVLSNWYCFFFNSRGPHGLGTLFLEALSSVYNGKFSDAPIEWPSDDCFAQPEVRTELGRVDIVLTDDAYQPSRGIVIENKVYASDGYNPLEDYPNAVETEIKYTIVLTLFQKEKLIDRSFRNITHIELVNAVRSRLGAVLHKLNPRYTQILLDLFQNIESMSKPTTRDNRELFQLMVEHGEHIQKLVDYRVKAMQAFSEELGKACALEGYLVQSSKYYSITIQPAYSSELYIIIYFDKLFSNREYKIHAWLGNRDITNAWHEWPEDDEDWLRLEKDFEEFKWHFSEGYADKSKAKFYHEEFANAYSSTAELVALPARIAQRLKATLEKPTKALLEILHRRMFSPIA